MFICYFLFHDAAVCIFLFSYRTYQIMIFFPLFVYSSYLWWFKLMNCVHACNKMDLGSSFSSLSVPLRYTLYELRKRGRENWFSDDIAIGRSSVDVNLTSIMRLVAITWLSCLRRHLQTKTRFLHTLKGPQSDQILMSPTLASLDLPDIWTPISPCHSIPAIHKSCTHLLPLIWQKFSCCLFVLLEFYYFRCFDAI